jgi:hypothetical protein
MVTSLIRGATEEDRMGRGGRMARLGLVIGVLLSLLVAPAESAAARTRAFGASIDRVTDPVGASPAFACFSGGAYACTWVMNAAYDGNGTHPLALRAPRDGVIAKVKILAATEGSFRLFLARTKSGPTFLYRSKVVRRGPAIRYEGNGSSACAPDCRIETFPIRLKVKKGDVLAFRSKAASFLRCVASPEDDILLYYEPPLAVGDPFRDVGDTLDCAILMKAVYARRR